MNQKQHTIRTVFRISPDYLYREIAGEAILVPVGEAALKFNGMATMNATAAFLWKQLEHGITLPELAKRLAQEYELTEEESSEDVNAFMDMALEHGIIIAEDPC